MTRRYIYGNNTAAKFLAFILITVFTFTSSLAQEEAISDTTSTEASAEDSSEESTGEKTASAEEASSGGSEGGIPTDEAIIQEGQTHWKQNCTQCHAFGKVLVGPDMTDAHKRWEVSNMVSFIQYPQKYITQAGDAYAEGLYEKYQQYMPNHDFLTEDQILATIAFIKDRSENPDKYVEKTAGAEETVAGGEGAATASGGGEYVSLLIGIMIFILAIILIVLVLIVSVINKILSQKENDLGEDEKQLLHQKVNFAAFFGSPAFKGFVAFFFVIIVGKVVLDSVLNIGIQQGYAPAQPIAFSHKLHAGHYEIECQYCHTGARKAKSANIPSVNICMNCHNGIRTGSPEIQKLYSAIETGRPIEWVRVHNLQDFAYFNHSQHVNVAGLECQNCHGPIEEMEVVQQWAPLTMGWCINCHRQTELDHAKDNDYYDKLVQLHENTSTEPMTVEYIGGLECSRCHY